MCIRNPNRTSQIPENVQMRSQREEYDWYAEELHGKVEQEAAKQAARIAAESIAPAVTGPMDIDHPRGPEVNVRMPLIAELEHACLSA